MSSLEVVQAIYELCGEKQFPEVLALFSPEIEIIQTKQLPWGGRYQGLDEARDFLSRLPRFVDATPIADRFIEAGDAVVVCGRLAGTVREFGTVFEIPIVDVWTVAEGLVTRFEPYVDTVEMLRILDEPAPAPPLVVAAAPVAAPPALPPSRPKGMTGWAISLIVGILLALGPFWGLAVSGLLTVFSFHAMSQGGPVDPQHLSNQMGGALLSVVVGFVACPIGFILTIVSAIFLIRASRNSLPPSTAPHL